MTTFNHYSKINLIEKVNSTPMKLYVEISFSKPMVEVSLSKGYHNLGGASLGGTYERTKTSDPVRKNHH
jgi:hypothetical protein